MEQEPELTPENSEKEICVEPEPIQIGGGGGNVNSVNGMTGDVVLKTSDLENDSGYQTAAQVDQKVTAAAEELTDDLATVATSGSYDDLSNKPTIPEAYALPAATASTLGGVKVGDGLSVEADGTISAEGGSGPTVVQTLGTSTDDVMSQKAVTDTLFADGATARQIKIGSNTSTSGSFTVTVGYGAATVSSAVALGTNAKATGNNSVALGYDTNTNYKGWSVALGRAAQPTRDGEVNIGTPRDPTKGYNDTAYRILGGLYDGQDNHDAVTVRQLNSAVGNIETVLQTLNSGSGV